MISQIPLIWDKWCPCAEGEVAKQNKNWQKKEDQRLQHLAAGTAKPRDAKPSPKPNQTPRMLRGDDDNFLKLAAALKIILSHSICITELSCAKMLLESYLSTFYKVSYKNFSLFLTDDLIASIQLHPTIVKPNFHWVIHIFDQIRDYGPVYNFWTFLFEHLNKVLKSYSVNNHEGGEVEITFLWAFNCDVALQDMVRNIFFLV
jgi:hypothetical protein